MSIVKIAIIKLLHDNVNVINKGFYGNCFQLYNDYEPSIPEYPLHLLSTILQSRKVQQLQC